MAMRFNIRQCDKIRESIEVGMVVEKLQRCLKGDIKLSHSQLTSARLLLGISMPNLTATEVSGEIQELPVLKIIKRAA